MPTPHEDWWPLHGANGMDSKNQYDNFFTYSTKDNVLYSKVRVFFSYSSAAFLKDFLDRGGTGNHSYMVYVDGFDTMLLGNASGIVEDFHSYDCELLVSSNWANPLENQDMIKEK